MDNFSSSVNVSVLVQGNVNKFSSDSTIDEVFPR